MGPSDVHYAGNLVDGARMLALFGDVATELLIRHDGDEGLFVGYESVQFKAPVYAGDYIEAKGTITRVGNTSRDMHFTAYKVIQSQGDSDRPTAARVLEKPVLVAEAKGTCVVPKERQRRKTSFASEEG